MILDLESTLSISTPAPATTPTPASNIAPTPDSTPAPTLSSTTAPNPALHAFSFSDGLPDLN